MASTSQIWAKTSDKAEEEIVLVDESALSGMKSKGPIVGCSDHSTKKELSCSKEPKDVILSQLPTSKQLSQTNLEDDNALDEIKSQLKYIIEELSKLKKEQDSNKKTIKELQVLVKVLSDKKTHTSVDKMKKVTRTIAKIKPKVIKRKKGEKVKVTIIHKKIKEIARFDDHVVIEVQRNESLSTYSQAYYHDNTKYYRIYRANRDKIGKNLQIIVGEHLTIPLK